MWNNGRGLHGLFIILYDADAASDLTRHFCTFAFMRTLMSQRSTVYLPDTYRLSRVKNSTSLEAVPALLPSCVALSSIPVINDPHRIRSHLGLRQAAPSGLPGCALLNCRLGVLRKEVGQQREAQNSHLLPSRSRLPAASDVCSKAPVGISPISTWAAGVTCRLLPDAKPLPKRGHILPRALTWTDSNGSPIFSRFFLFPDHCRIVQLMPNLSESAAPCTSQINLKRRFLARLQHQGEGTLGTKNPGEDACMQPGSKRDGGSQAKQEAIKGAFCFHTVGDTLRWLAHASRPEINES